MPIERRHGGVDGGPMGVGELDDGVTQSALELTGGTFGHHRSSINDHYAVGEAVRLLQILRGEQHRGAVGHQFLDHRPQPGTTGGIKTRGGLIQEQYGRLGHQRRRQIETATHAPGIGSSGTVAGIAEVESFQEFRGPGSGGRHSQMVESTHQRDVFMSGEVLIHGCVLTGQANAGAHRLGGFGHVVTVDHGPPRVWLDDGGEDAHGSGFACAVGAEQAQHSAGGYLQAHPPQCLHRAELLVQIVGQYCGSTHEG